MSGYTGKIGLGATQNLKAPIAAKKTAAAAKKAAGKDLRTGK